MITINCEMTKTGYNNGKNINGKIMDQKSSDNNCYFMEEDVLIGKFEEVTAVSTGTTEVPVIKIENGTDNHSEEFPSGDYNFECSLCMFTTSDESILKSHMLEHINGPDLDTFVEESHNGENYTCLFCPFSSVSSEMLKYHIRFKHSTSTSQENFPIKAETLAVSFSPKTESPIKPLTNIKSEQFPSTSPEQPIVDAENGNLEKSKVKKRKRTEKKKFSLVEGQTESNLYNVPIRKCRKCSFQCYDNYELTDHFDQQHPELLNYCQKCTYMTPYFSTFQRHLESHKKEEMAGIPINPIYQPKRAKVSSVSNNLINRLPPAPPPAPVEPARRRRRSIVENKKIAKSPVKKTIATKVEKTPLSKNARKSEIKSVKTSPIIKVGAAKSFQCPTCPFKTGSRNHYVRHERIHTGEKPYACPYCDYCCNQASTMKIHVRRHTGEKPFSCKMCPFRTIAHGDLTSHIKRHERTDNSVSCHICHQIFFSLKAMEKHKNGHEGDNASGGIKEVKVKTRLPPQEEVVVPKRKKIAVEAVTKSKKLKSEPKTKNAPEIPSIYRCSHCSYTCDKFLLLTEHLTTHKGEAMSEEDRTKYKKYSCKICLIYFDSRKEKKRHKKAFHRDDVEPNIGIKVNALNSDDE